MNTMHWIYWVFLFLMAAGVVGIVGGVIYWAVGMLRPSPPQWCVHCPDGDCIRCNGH